MLLTDFRSGKETTNSCGYNPVDAQYVSGCLWVSTSTESNWHYSDREHACAHVCVRVCVCVCVCVRVRVRVRACVRVSVRVLLTYNHKNVVQRMNCKISTWTWLLIMPKKIERETWKAVKPSTEKVRLWQFSVKYIILAQSEAAALLSALLKTVSKWSCPSMTYGGLYQHRCAASRFIINPWSALILALNKIRDPEDFSPLDGWFCKVRFLMNKSRNACASTNNSLHNWCLHI